MTFDCIISFAWRICCTIHILRCTRQQRRSSERAEIPYVAVYVGVVLTSASHPSHQTKQVHNRNKLTYVHRAATAASAAAGVYALHYATIEDNIERKNCLLAKEMMKWRKLENTVFNFPFFPILWDIFQLLHTYSYVYTYRLCQKLKSVFGLIYHPLHDDCFRMKMTWIRYYLCLDNLFKNVDYAWLGLGHCLNSDSSSFI